MSLLNVRRTIIPIALTAVATAGAALLFADTSDGRAFADAAPPPQAVDVPVLVSTAWVAEHLDDPEVLIVQVGMPGMTPLEDFIPGSVVLDYHSIETSEGLAVELPPADDLVPVFEAAGVSTDKHVVLYARGAAHIAARAFVTLEYLSHPRVSVMDGGLETWLHEGRPTTTTPADPEPANLAYEVNDDVLADAAWIEDHLGDPLVALIDARPASQFAGPSNRGLREGHIPGAGNLYFVELLESEELPQLRSRDEVEALFADAGFTPGATVVSYCQIGMRASYNYLIARHLGYEVKFYDGSWQEWGADETLPAETGPRRR
jgi:thiosulfate/3-mercaptopyruvate sulfurtransferase